MSARPMTTATTMPAMAPAPRPSESLLSPVGEAVLLAGLVAVSVEEDVEEAVARRAAVSIE